MVGMVTDLQTSWRWKDRRTEVQKYDRMTITTVSNTVSKKKKDKKQCTILNMIIVFLV